jgi:molybdopterin-guanine dinucleotide biosynthesis protein A
MGLPDKALLTVGGRTMLAAVIAALDLPNIAISANGDPSRFAAFGLPVLPDGQFNDQGPLAGILSGLEWAGGLGMTALMSVPGDTPLLPRGLASQLWPPPCAAQSDGRRHHLIALWPVSCACALRTALSSPGNRSAGAFASKLDFRYREYDTYGNDFFVNVNTPEELKRIRMIVGGT